MQKKAGMEALGSKKLKWRQGLVCIAFLLSACTADSVPDEEFEAPTMNFPLLGHVPDRPVLEPSTDIARQQKHLQQEHDQAFETQSDIIKSIKS